MDFAQAHTHNDNRVKLRARFIEALYIKTPIFVRITIPKDRLAVFTNYPSDFGKPTKLSH